MNCTELKNSLDDWLDGDLSPGQAAAVEAHAAGCPACQARLARARDLQARLRRLPAPEPDAALFDRALAAAAAHDLQRRRRTWLGAGGALAASLVLVIGVSASFQTGQLGQPGQPGLEEAIPGLDIALHEERDISLVVESREELDSATFTVVLPPGIELAGYPGVSEISWEGRLKPGKNLLVLPVRAQAGGGGNVVTHVSHTGKLKTFTVRMAVTAEQKSLGLPSSSDALTM